MRKAWFLLAVFVIAALAGEGDFSFVILGDRTGEHHEGVYEAVIAQSLFEGADFYVSVGDQIEGYTFDPEEIDAQWVEYFTIIEPVPLVVHLTPGNHDIWDDASLGPCDASGPTVSPATPRTGRTGSTTPACTSSCWTPAAGISPSICRRTRPSATFAWLEDDLSSHDDARLTLVFTHKPLIYSTLGEGSGDRLHKIFLEHGVDGVFTGHFRAFGRTEYDGIPTSPSAPPVVTSRRGISSSTPW